MVKALIAGKQPHEVLQYASKRLRTPRAEILEALHGELSGSHLFVLTELMQHIEDLEARVVRFDVQMLAGLEKEQAALNLLQTIPGIDVIGAAMLLVEIGTDMSVFGSADILLHD